MILEPNQRRRTRLVRSTAGIVAVLVIASASAWVWAHPAPLSIAQPTASLVATISPTATIVPSPTTPPPSPSPIPSYVGCAPAPAELVPAVLASHGLLTKKVVALTFDDGASGESTQRILQTLVRERVNATFFPTGFSVDRFPDVWRRVGAARFPVGNHTYSHQSLAGRCYEDQLAELHNAERVLRALGLSLLPVMRPPYEEWDDATRLAASAAGESHVVLWNVDTFDWTGVSASTIVARALAGREGSIILMHTTANTAVALPTIIHRYRDRGFRFVTVGTMLGIPGAVPFP